MNLQINWKCSRLQFAVTLSARSNTCYRLQFLPIFYYLFCSVMAFNFEPTILNIWRYFSLRYHIFLFFCIYFHSYMIFSFYQFFWFSFCPLFPALTCSIPKSHCLLVYGNHIVRKIFLNDTDQRRRHFFNARRHIMLKTLIITNILMYCLKKYQELKCSKSNSLQRANPFVIISNDFILNLMNDEPFIMLVVPMYL